MKLSCEKSFVLSLTCLTYLMVSCSSQPARADLPLAAQAAAPGYAELLASYVKAKGVDYAAWHGNPQAVKKLRSVVDFYANTLPPKNKDAALAWYLNAYNAWILHEIIGKYPTTGPMDGNPLFFRGNRITVAGSKMSFNHLEQKIIRPTFQEPRIHFALNCASESCPPLQTDPFQVATLDSDLNRLTRAFINDNPQGVVAKRRELKLSKLFDWYAEDFGGKDGVIKYINRYRNQAVPGNAKIHFMDYSWKLNSL